VTTAVKTFRAEWRYSIRYRVLDRATNCIIGFQTV